jgi:hypothetical protein
MYNRNGPMFHPWGTPQVTLATLTLCFEVYILYLFSFREIRFK